MSAPAAPVPAPPVARGRARADLSVVRWIGGRVAASIAVIFVLSLIIFASTEVIPGDVVTSIVGQYGTDAQREAVTQNLGLDAPPVERYLDWLGGAIGGDFGKSPISGQPVAGAIATAAGKSALLAITAAGIGILVAVVLGSALAIYRDTRFERVVSPLVLIGLSVPEFVLGIVLIWIFGVQLGLLPALSILPPDASTWDQVRILILPAIALTPMTAAYMTRTMRAAMTEVLDEEFIELSSLKGVGRWRTIWRHAVPNALIPMIHVFALNIGWLVGSVVVVEVVFAYPGLGKLLLDAVNRQDVALVQGAGLLIGAVYVALNFAADMIVAAIDPRTRQRQF
jgi:peptide/nickel transport system permease protein